MLRLPPVCLTQDPKSLSNTSTREEFFDSPPSHFSTSRNELFVCPRMVDVVRVGSGIAALLPVSINRYKTIYEGAKVAKRCRHELEYLYKDLKVQHKIFINECKALLIPTDEQDKDLLHAAMVADTCHDAWNTEELTERLKNRLPDKYRDCKDIIKRILEEQDQLIHQLQVFDPVRKQRMKVSYINSPRFDYPNWLLKGESWKNAYCRLQASIKFPFDLSKVEKKIKSLRRQNRDLSMMRKQIDDIDQSSMLREPLSYKPTPCFAEGQEVSEEAYEALSASFTCAEPTHSEHSVFLCLEENNIGESHLRMAIESILGSSSYVSAQLDDKPMILTDVIVRETIRCVSFFDQDQ